MRVSIKLVLVLLVSTLVATACSPSFRNHGLVPRDDQLAEVVVGKDTKETVAEKIGQPSLDSLRSVNAWYYVESRFRHMAFFAPEEIDRQVVKISFNGDRVANIETFGLEDGQVVRLTARETKVGDTDLGFLAAIFRNLGNVDPASLIN